MEVFELDLLKQQNGSQRYQIQWFAAHIKDHEENLAYLHAFERKLRIIVNFPGPATYNRLSGVGGSVGDEHQLSSLNKEHNKLVDDLRMNIEHGMCQSK
jgi:hypothetical protein